MKILFMGTPSFAARHLQFLLDQGLEVVGVVTQPARPRGRSGKPQPSPVAEVAAAAGLPVIETSKPSSEEMFPQLQALAPDLIVLVAYGALLREDVLALPPKGCINVHPSLLPKYRGAAPLQRAIMAGERETGVCIMHMVKALDAGDVIACEKLPIGPETTYGELEEQVGDLSTKLLVDCVGQIERGVAPRTPQAEEGVTYAKKIEPADCELNFEKPAAELHNLVRALSPRPGAWCMVRVKGVPKRLKVFRTRISEEGALVVACAKESLSLLEVQLEGKGRMSAADLMRGLPLASLSFA